jgi:ATP phosphoribosyltransferase regulatory subunit
LIDADPALKAIAHDVCTLLNAKDVPGLAALGERLPDVRPESIDALLALASLYGSDEVTTRARAVLPALPGVVAALDELDALVHAMPGLEFTIDLADIGSGYGYHSGVVFSIYAQGWHDALVKGGRYDGIGKAFGRSRPATGFSMDLRKLSSGLPPAPLATAIRAPWGTQPELLSALRELRESGEIVVQLLPGQPHGLDEFIVDRELVFDNETWKVRAIQ